MNLVTYMRIGTALTHFFRSLKRNRKTDGSCVRINQFLLGFKKGSKQLRKILSNDRALGEKILQESHVRTFHRLIDCEPVSAVNIRWIQKSWSFYFLPNKLREFILKFNGNLLGINTRVSHFAEVNRACTFCAKNNVVPAPDESFKHLFLLCPVTNRILLYFLDNFFMDLVPPDAEHFKKFWFLHLTSNDLCNRNVFFSIVLWSIKYTIWEYKLAKKCPSPRTVLVDVLHLLNCIYNSSSILADSKSLINVHISRNWDRIRHG